MAEQCLDVHEDSDTVPNPKWLQSPVRVVDAQNAILSLESKNSDSTQMILHALKDGYYRREIVTIDLSDSYVERAPPQDEA